MRLWWVTVLLTVGTVRGALPEVWSDIVGRTGGGRLPEDARAALALERVKQSILAELGFSGPPKLPSGPMPLPPVRFLDQHHAATSASAFPISRETVFVRPTKYKCTLDNEEWGLDLQFELPARLQAEDVVSAYLWTQPYEYGNTSFLPESCILFSSVCNNSLLSGRPSAHSHQLFVKDGWIQLDLLRNLKDWLEYRELCHNITITQEVPKNAMSCYTPQESNKHPFLVVTVDVAYKVNREKRNLNCIKGMTECCRENLIVSFRDMGWDQWINHPSDYNAYYCKGRCSKVTAITLGSYHAVIQKVKGNRRELVDLTPCCAPKRLSSMSLVYRLDNGTFLLKQIPDMIVESCGCV